MRIRHGLKLNQENDFDIGTQDLALKVFEQVTKYIYLGLVVISSIALMVGGIGVMAIMMISVTERTREIGVRKALGARRREILWQFLLEAVVLTGVGGVLGHRRSASASATWSTALTGLPVVAQLEAVRHRHGLLLGRRHHLRHAARHAGLAAGSHRGAPVRVRASGWRLETSRPATPAANTSAAVRIHRRCRSVDCTSAARPP